MNPSSPNLHLWKISIRAKSRLFDLRLNASNVFPNLGNGGERISFLLRLLRLLLLKVKSEIEFLQVRRQDFEEKQRRMDPHNRSRARDHGTGTRHRHDDYFLDQVLLSRISLLFQRNLILWLIISAFISFFLYKVDSSPSEPKFSSGWENLKLKFSIKHNYT
ncbi:uncharacterized protein LOC109848306 isoform X2 [Asparagus officinalis]|uniref:uncharacterized protein LOC109848306 isoform X2 n=1 Tax=Asparagus officinalis TaxID=4686 RepID=UPI00098E64D0|nr:uncharacterized protein LOC109848306 isoform X2 [Asparagus officinalis]